MTACRTFILVLTCCVLALPVVLGASTTPKGLVSRFSAKTLRTAVERFLRNRLESSDTFTIAESISDQVFDEPGVTARCDASVESLRGSTRIPIIFLKDEETVRRIYVPARITRMRTAPVLTRSVRKGDLLQESDVEQRLIDVTYLNGECARDVTGKRSTIALTKGSIITTEHLAPPSSIQRGDVVTLHVVSGSVIIRTTGVALDDAASGQAVRVRRQDTSVILTGTASENKTVTLSLDRS